MPAQKRCRNLVEVAAYGVGSFSGDAAPEWFSDHGMLPLAVSSTLELYGKGYCVYLSGNVPSEELLQIANSLHAAGP